MNYLAKNLNHLRKGRGLKQDELKDLLGIARATWSNYENGQTEPDIETLINISKFFGITIDDLLLRELKQVDTLPEEITKDTGSDNALWQAIKDLQGQMTELKSKLNL